MVRPKKGCFGCLECRVLFGKFRPWATYRKSYELCTTRTTAAKTETGSTSSSSLLLSLPLSSSHHRLTYNELINSSFSETQPPFFHSGFFPTCSSKTRSKTAPQTISEVERFLRALFFPSFLSAQLSVSVVGRKSDHFRYSAATEYRRMR